MLLSKNQRFIQEYSEFSAKIEKISNEQIKNECYTLLRELKKNVQDIDKQHVQFTNTRMSDHLSEVRNNIQSIRKKLQSLLKN
jgi:hypothetical protein